MTKINLAIAPDYEVRDAAERTNKMGMYTEYDSVIDDIYRMKKGV